jgi:hypothetical protein
VVYLFNFTHRSRLPDHNTGLFSRHKTCQTRQFQPQQTIYGARNYSDDIMLMLMRDSRAVFVLCLLQSKIPSAISTHRTVGLHSCIGIYIRSMPETRVSCTSFNLDQRAPTCTDRPQMWEQSCIHIQNQSLSLSPY